VGEYVFFSNLTGFKNLSGCISLYYAKGFALLRGQKGCLCRVCFLFHSVGFCFYQSQKTMRSWVFFSNLTGFKNLTGCISLFYAKGFALLRGQKRVFVSCLFFYFIVFVFVFIKVGGLCVAVLYNFNLLLF
jgi:hypothetical protein